MTGTERMDLVLFHKHDSLSNNTMVRRKSAHYINYADCLPTSLNDLAADCFRSGIPMTVFQNVSIPVIKFHVALNLNQTTTTAVFRQKLDFCPTELQR